MSAKWNDKKGDKDMILPNRGLSNEKIKGISSNFKKALVTGVVFATVALSGLSLTGCGIAADTDTAKVQSESENSIYKPGKYNVNKNCSFSEISYPINGDYYSYIVDELTEVVYLKYDGEHEAGLTPALMIDEETGATRVMTKADLEKILELNAEAERDF